MLSTLTINAQITIANSDMPIAGDTFRLSTAPLSTVVDLSLTGTNYLWDFSTLLSNSQAVDSFYSVASTGLVYSFFFINSGLNTNRANLVTKGADITAIPTFTVTDVNNFYYAASAQFRQVGIGASLNGITTPIAFGNKDIIYNFPLNYGDQDSSDSDYGISLPGLGTYQAIQKRINNVDGWGTVITPFGSFSALRIVAELSGSDSLYLDTLGFGFNLPRPITREYKWLAVGEGVPVLQINTTFAGPTETITSIRYKDSLTVTGLSQLVATSKNFTLWPNPSSQEAVLKSTSPMKGEVAIRLTDARGVTMGNSVVQSSELQQGIALNQLFNVTASGIYFVEIKGPENQEIIRWIFTR